MQDMPEPQPPPPPGAVIMQMMTARMIAQAIGVAASFGFADHLAAGPKTAEELAGLTGTHGPSVYRLLRALASNGIFVEQEAGRFANTPLSEALREGVPGSARGLAVFLSHEFHVQAWLGLKHSVKTGQSGFEHVHGESFWTYLRARPEASAVFDDAMTSGTAQVIAGVVSAYDFSGINTLVDVGGGRGALMAAILEKNPHLKGVVFDQPHVVEAASAILSASGVADRCRIEGGDFFKEVPEGDAFIMKSIVHDWSDEDSVAILSTVARAAKPGARLLLVEGVIKPGNEPDFMKTIDLEMIVITNGGRERTEEEFAGILGRAGFTRARVIPTGGPSQIIEAIRA